MREILFRGKRTDNCEWLYGYYFFENINLYANFNGCHYVHPCGQNQALSVIPETVGQYTGLTDKNSTKIFEGDIVKAQDDIFSSPFCNGITGKVVYEETAFFIEPKDPMETQWLFNECAVYEVIGNIHDNPELLKEG